MVAVDVTDEVRIARNRETVLWDIRYTSKQLHDTLLRVQKDATEALEALSKGLQLSGSTNFGPVGHQAPFDIAVQTARLQMQIQTAIALGVDEADIQKAYTVTAGA